MFSYDEVYNATLNYFNGDDLAANVFVTKYALKDADGNYLEKTPDDMHHRLAKEFARIEAKFEKNALSEEQIFDFLKNFRYIVPQGSPMAGIGNNYQNTSLSNCSVIKPPEDTMSSIFNTARDMANLYKRRFGVGTDLSKLRPSGAPVSNAAKTSTGAYSFADFYSNVTKVIGQNSRRGALMLTMDVRHPDIENFVTMKHDLKKVTSANVSVKLTQEFMECVEKDEAFRLRWPVDSVSPKTVRDVRARDLWSLIISSATKYAEPGLFFWDTILKNLPAQCYADVGFEHYSSNPCGEIILNEDSCRLISMNLKFLVNKPFTIDANIDYQKLEKIVYVAQRLSDDLVELELEKLDNLISCADTEDEKDLFRRLKKSCTDGRRTGLGTHGLADMLSRLCLPYDSDEALNVIDKVYSINRDTSYQASVDLAKERGPFPVWNWEKEKDNAFIQRLPEELQKEIQTYGRRNIANLTNAPTGSVSILSQTSSGIEPVFRNTYTRRRKLSGGQDERVDFVDASGDKWQEFSIAHHNVEEWQAANPKKKLPKYFIESDNIDWKRRVEIQATITKYIDHSISSTINLPEGTKETTVGEIYMQAWKLGCKGITVYVDKCRDGVLITNKDSNIVKRPEALDCAIYHISVKGEKWIVLVGLMNGKPYEIFGGSEEDSIEIPKKYTTGKIIKVKSTTKNRYDLHFGEDGVIKDIVKMFDSAAYSTYTRLISLHLRHGININFLVEQLLKDPDGDMTSFTRAISRVLKKYIEDGTKVTSEKTCGACGQDSLRYMDGCISCSNCGWSKCS
jgi:ribonucleoside-diphosphate reductase alpha chain